MTMNIKPPNKIGHIVFIYGYYFIIVILYATKRANAGRKPLGKGAATVRSVH